ncbi:uncharacterized protein LOC120129435 [Hibiscus syriacus]|uniref:uncharacterized protein LOC120129435 n=1 Tax=Hibiscus syriacus TaxID=106335 RepID=UPI0019214FF3|nr:uncharacterized protein LOC120129435 [Hibiscus syriacus]
MIPSKQSIVPTRPPPPLFNWSQRPLPTATNSMLVSPNFQNPTRLGFQQPKDETHMFLMPRSSETRMEDMMAEHENDIKWSNGLIDSLENLGGNNVANKKYEALLPDNITKLTPDSSNEERADFIKRKYEMLQFLDGNDHEISPIRLINVLLHHLHRVLLPPCLPKIKDSLRNNQPDIV